MNKIGYIILNYNNWSDTLKCIKSLKFFLQINEYIYIVDNASSMPPPPEYYEFFDHNTMRHIKSNFNGGYSSGNNQGIKFALSEGCNYFIVCNNDLIFNMPISDKLVNYAVNHDDIGILAPKVIGPNGLPQEINTGLPLTLANKYKYLLKETPLSFLFKEFIEENNAIKYKFDRPLGLFSVSGCCFMITKKSLDFIFPLDEDFFLYMEEQIIGIKLTKYSLKAVILPNCHVIHMHGKTTSKVAAFSFSCLIQSEILYFRKYHNSSLLYLFPLLLLRICQFIYRSLFSSDYRKGVFILLSKIYNALRIKYA